MRSPAVAVRLILCLAVCPIVSAGLPASARTGEAGRGATPLRLDRLQARIDSLEARIAAVGGGEPYVVIDRTHNRLELRQDDRILQQAVCATGSGRVLLGDGRDRWMFETPRGAFRVQKKVTDPIWAKPEWAFVEAGEEPPVLPWMFNRLDPTTLGDYALELGDGYEIHGTLYPTLLGRSITHGCIRLGDDDLEALFTAVPVNTPVIIY